MRLAGLVLVASLLGGCAYTLHVTSLPDGASVEGPKGQIVTTPGDLRVPNGPFARQPIKVTMPGYREFATDLRWRGGSPGEGAKAVFLRPRVVLGSQRYRRVEFVLVPEHGALGTWAEPAPQD